MAKELTHESWKIANIIYCDLLYGPLARDYLKERLETGSCKVGGFDFQEDVYCWAIINKMQSLSKLVGKHKKIKIFANN